MKSRNKETEKKIYESIRKRVKEFQEMQEMINATNLGAEEILNRKVIKVGNSGRIAVPSKHIGKQVKVYILSNQFEKQEEEKPKES